MVAFAGTKVVEIGLECPTYTVSPPWIEAWSSFTLISLFTLTSAEPEPFTVILQVALLLPTRAVTFAVPFFLPLTTPLEFTVTTLLFEVLHFTFFLGATFARRARLCPALMDADFLLSDRETYFTFTFTYAVFFLFLLSVTVTLILAAPAFLAVITPFLLTVATLFLVVL